MEALMIASKGAKQALTDQEYLQIIDEMGLRPRIIDFYEKNCGREGAQFE
jgi:PHP family Zn ribbon phosphoesterase